MPPRASFVISIQPVVVGVALLSARACTIAEPRDIGALEPSAASASGVLATSDIDPLKQKTDGTFLCRWLPPVLSKHAVAAEEWSSTSRPAAAPGTTWTETASNAAGTATGVASSAAATATGVAVTAASMTTGAAKLAYGTAVGNEQMKKEGSEQVWGKPSQ